MLDLVALLRMKADGLTKETMKQINTALAGVDISMFFDIIKNLFGEWLGESESTNMEVSTTEPPLMKSNVTSLKLRVILLLLDLNQPSLMTLITHKTCMTLAFLSSIFHLISAK